MTIDLLILSIIICAGVIGWILGAARQISQWAAFIAACFAARPLGSVLAPKVAHQFHASLGVSVVIGTVVAFIGVLMLVRFALTRILQSVFRGKDFRRENRDRVFGGLLGAAKAAALAYVILSALTFAEEHIDVAGRHMGLSPKQSWAFGFARAHNLFEMTMFAPVKDLARVEQALRDPAKASHVKMDPALRALLSDGRFREVINTPALKKAFLQGDIQGLLRNNTLVELIRDPVIAERLKAAAEAVDR